MKVLLVSKQNTFNAGTKQNHTADVWKGLFRRVLFIKIQTHLNTIPNANFQINCPITTVHKISKDTNDGCGSNSQDCPNGDGLLGIPQVAWPVWTSHDTWWGGGHKRKSNI